jgi:hypothetical protein
MVELEYVVETPFKLVSGDDNPSSAPGVEVIVLP